MAEQIMRTPSFKRVLSKHRKVIFIVGGITFATVLVFTFIATPIYEATAMIKVSKQPGEGISLDMLGMGQASVANDAREEMRSIGILSEVVANLHLEEQPYLIKPNPLKALASAVTGGIKAIYYGLKRIFVTPPAGKPADLVKEMAYQVQNKKVLIIKPISESSMVLVNVRTDDPEEAAAVANEVSSVYERASVEREKEDITERAGIVEEQLEEARQRLRDSEKNLEEFEQKEGVKAGENVDAVNKTLDDVENLRKAIEDNQADKQKLLNRGYTAEHPDIVKLDNEIQALIDRRNAKQGDLGRQPEVLMKLSRLKRIVTSNNEMYNKLLKRRDEISLQHSGVIPNVRMVDRADVPEKPIKPKKALNIIIGLIAGLIVGAVAAFTKEYQDKSVKSPLDLKEALGMNVLGTVGSNESSRVFYERESDLPESYRIIRTKLFLMSETGGSRVLSVTGCTGENQGGIIATNLAIAFALSPANNVLLIDANLREPAIHNHVNVRQTYGLADILSGALPDTKTALKKTKLPNLQVMSTGDKPQNPSELLLDTKRLESLMASLRKDYNFIIFDCPPVCLFSDAAILGRHMDGTVIVSALEKTQLETVTQAADTFKETQAKVLGAVVKS